MLFLLVWTGGVLIAALKGFEGSSSAAEGLVPLLMACAGAFMFVYVIWSVPRSARNTAYGVTDRRAIIIRGSSLRRVESLPLQGMTRVVLREHGLRAGTIVFKSFTQGSGEDEYTPEFSMLEDARHVYELILKYRSLPEHRS
jgi:hypothetical protein